jgi:hypothetical protein
VLADVDFSQAPVPAGLDWGKGIGDRSPLRPFGPLLLLPFLAARTISVFVPYSSYWFTPEVLRNGYVGVALALIFSVLEDGRFSVQSALDRVADLGKHGIRAHSAEQSEFAGTAGSSEHSTGGATSGSMLNESRDALVKGLYAFRNRLLSRSDAPFVDVVRTKERLEALEERACERSEWPMSVPFNDEQGFIGIAFLATPAGPIEEIQVASFFADLLGFQPPSDGTRLSELYVELDRYSGRSLSFRGGLFANYEYACKALAGCGVGCDLKSVVEEMMQDGPDLDWEFVRRLAVEFAWVQAWSKGKQKGKSFIHTLLGFRVRQADGKVRMHPNVTNNYRRLISVGDEMTLDANSPRRPFKNRSEENRYNLDQDADADLTEMERILCRKYAEEQLRWVEYRSGRTFPMWMKSRDERL